MIFFQMISFYLKQYLIVDEKICSELEKRWILCIFGMKQQKVLFEKQISQNSTKRF